ncbi:DnaJ domain-containing protein [Aspergillus cavernicola]|uniref:DnaJ domain-containing protein n=1 Tax=Aspergillus cavernicola TaxID=176166 RepID=A0ABR4J046_9EURO
MPFPRHLRSSISQLLLDNPHFHIYTPSSSCHGREHRHGDTHKATFSTTHPQSYASSREPNHYEILDVPVTANPSEIKKKFYSLSLRHHPDRNPSDPDASSRFAKISSAYQVLSNAAKRSAYDHEAGIHSFTSTSTHSTANPGQNPMGSHSSHSSHYYKSGGGAGGEDGGASYFGSRPASGLSKRRGAFRGPPPSFYAHGGYGNRKAPPHSSASGGAARGGGGGGRSASSGAGSEDDDPMSFIDRNPLSHFNARGHYQTQTVEDARRHERRRHQRRSKHFDEDINEQLIGSRGGLVLRFVAVSSILVGAVALTGLIRWPSSTNGMERSGKTPKSSRLKDG